MKNGKPTSKAPVSAASPKVKKITAEPAKPATPPAKPQPAKVTAVAAKPAQTSTAWKSPAKKSAATVRLEFYAPAAQEVYVAGSFNDWRPSATAMLASGGGQWARDLALAPGRYEYLFLVDGRWLPDPNAKEFAPNPFGGMNSLLEVPSNGK